MGPAEVLWVSGVDFAVPVVGEAEFLELAAEVVCVGLCGDAWVGAGFYGVLFGGESEGVPAHGVEDVKAVHALIACDDVGGGVSFWVADVEASARGVGEHVEDVVFRFGGIKAFVAGVGGAVGFVFGPVCLPFGLEEVEGVGFGFFWSVHGAEGSV